MENYDWMEPSGGPLMLIGREVIELWSGILERQSYFQGESRVSTDYMDPLETDYGKACSITDYLGVVDIENQKVLVFADEPLPTALVLSSNYEVIIAQWVYGEKGADRLLQTVDFLSLNWHFNEVIKFSSAEQYLFVAAIDGRSLLARDDVTFFLEMNLFPGEYQVFSSFYEPDHQTRFFLYKLMTTN
jgi:hypothetical protein